MKEQILVGNLRCRTVALIRVFLLIIFCESIAILLISNVNKSGKYSETSLGNVSHTKWQWQEYLPINLEYGKWASKLGFGVDTDPTPECKYHTVFSNNLKNDGN